VTGEHGGNEQLATGLEKTRPLNSSCYVQGEEISGKGLQKKPNAEEEEGGSHREFLGNAMDIPN